MITIYSRQRAKALLAEYAPWLEEISRCYGLPSPLLKAVLYKEMTEIDLLDLAADLVVSTGCFPKKDSSTGYGQVFGVTGVKAINFACDHGLASYAALGFSSDHRLDPQSLEDIRAVWKRLHREPRFNMEIAALTLLCAADEVTGRTDFARFLEEELKLILTRYNADIRHVTPYGEEVYALYQTFSTET